MEVLLSCVEVTLDGDRWDWCNFCPDAGLLLPVATVFYDYHCVCGLVVQTPVSHGSPVTPLVPVRLKTSRSRVTSLPSGDYEIPLDPDWEFPRDRYS